MRIIHCADIHLESGMRTHLGSERAAQRKNELMDTFLRMVDHADKNEADAVLIAGDLFDTGNVSRTAVKTVLEAISDKSGIDFYYIKGNHGTDGFLQDAEALPDNLKTFGHEWKYYDCGESGRICIAGKDMTGAEDAPLYDSLCLESDNINIVMLHGQIVPGGRDGTDISVTGLRNKGIDYLALGHIHQYHEEALDGRGILCYPGCLEGRGFDECGQHGFIQIDIDEKTGVLQHHFVPFAYRTLHSISVDITNCENHFEIVKAIDETLKTAAGVSEQKDMVKIVLEGSIPPECDINTEYLMNRYSDHYYFVKVSDGSRIMVDPQRYARDISLKGEFVRMVMADNGLTEEEKTEMIHCGLRAINGEEVLP